jgi:beta-phosphoglucomutase-like phosphatase (HAD superfamily)
LKRNHHAYKSAWIEFSQGLISTIVKGKDMIQAMIFDLDGTLVQTERLKALSYARAVIELCPHEVNEAEVVEAFKDVVGLSRREVAQALVERFHLEEKAQARSADFGVSTAWQAFIQVRLQHYDSMLADPQILIDSRWHHNLALLEEARRANCKTGLATMSRCQQAQRVLKILSLESAFDFVASRDDVNQGKPDPEIYRLVASELQVSPSDCLVIAAGMWCIAVTTPFTREAIHAKDLLDERWIVDNPDDLLAVVKEMMEAHNNIG